jgi:hypothetical protein
MTMRHGDEGVDGSTLGPTQFIPHLVRGRVVVNLGGEQTTDDRKEKEEKTALFDRVLHRIARVGGDFKSNFSKGGQFP